jgi:hypothetical protein
MAPQSMARYTLCREFKLAGDILIQQTTCPNNEPNANTTTTSGNENILQSHGAQSCLLQCTIETNKNKVASSGKRSSRHGRTERRRVLMPLIYGGTKPLCVADGNNSLSYIHMQSPVRVWIAINHSDTSIYHQSTRQFSLKFDCALQRGRDMR